jgi:hypothetical protein
MKIWITVGFLLALTGCAFAGEGETPDINDTWAKFQLAVARDNIDELSRISHFPIESNDFGGAIKSRDILAERYPTIFYDAMKRCVANNKPVTMEGYRGYIVDCNNDNLAIGLGFEKFADGYRFSYIDNANAE